MIINNTPGIAMKTTMRYAIVFALVLTSSLFAASAQTGDVSGRVKEINGKAIEGVVVRAFSVKDKDKKYETSSDGKGEFEFKGLPPGAYTFSFEKQGFKTFTTRKLNVTPGELTKLSKAIELAREDPPYAVIRGAVFQGPGYSLPGATVTIERIDGGKKFKQQTISHDGGEFAFRLKAEKAKYRITATARGYQASSTEIEIEYDEVRNIALTLK
jgi:uncharacterized membrane protein